MPVSSFWFMVTKALTTAACIMRSTVFQNIFVQLSPHNSAFHKILCCFFCHGFISIVLLDMWWRTLWHLGNSVAHVTSILLLPRCNVPLADVGLFEERQLPFYQRIAENPVSNCFEGQGPGAVVTNQIMCIDDKPQLQIRWIIPFLDTLDDDKEFTCLLNRQ